MSSLTFNNKSSLRFDTHCVHSIINRAPDWYWFGNILRQPYLTTSAHLLMAFPKPSAIKSFHTDAWHQTCLIKGYSNLNKRTVYLSRIDIAPTLSHKGDRKLILKFDNLTKRQALREIHMLFLWCKFSLWSTIYKFVKWLHT